MKRPIVAGLVIIGAIITFGMVQENKPVADSDGQMVVISVGIADSYAKEILEVLAQDIRDSLRGAGPIRRSRPTITEDAVSIRILRSDDVALAQTVLSDLADGARFESPHGTMTGFVLESDMEAGSFVLRLPPEQPHNAERDQAERALPVLRSRLGEDAKVTITSATTIAIWISDAVDPSHGHHRSALKSHVLAIHVLDTQSDQVDIERGVVRAGYRAIRDAKVKGKLWPVSRMPVLSTLDMSSVRATAIEQDGAGILRLHLSDGTRRHSAGWTLDQVGQRIAIVLDSEVISTPVLREPIFGSTISIHMGLPFEEVERIVDGLDPLTRHFRFEEIASCKKSRLEFLADPSC